MTTVEVSQIDRVSLLMGHSHIRTTERYLHSNDDRKVEAIRSLQFGG
jgi:integrase